MNTRERLFKIIKEISNGEVNQWEITDDTDLIEGCNFDSIKIIQMIICIEDEFQIEVEDEDLDLLNITIVSNIIRMIEKKL